MPFPTAGDVINTAAVEIGLGAVNDPIASTDDNFVQMKYLLKSCGQKLVHMREWTHLMREHTFVTVAGTSEYDLPADFHNMIDQTGWVRSTRLPLGGPLSPQEWQYLRARVGSLTFTVLFRPLQGKMFLYPAVDTPGDLTIAYEYITRHWVSTGAETTPSKEIIEDSGDIVYFDDLLLSRFLKLEMLKAKGFDYAEARRDFDQTMQLVAGDDSPGPMLNLSRPPTTFQLVGERNVPITGFGS